jgi:hypothetical protein
MPPTYRIETRDANSDDPRDWTTDDLGDPDANAFTSEEQAEQTIATLRTYGEDWAAAAYRVVEVTTSAQEISARFGDDGQRWTDADGVELEGVLDADAHTFGERNAAVPQRWQFADGSAIITTDAAWDLGVTDTDDHDRRSCVCWSDDGVTCREQDNCSCACHSEVTS